MVADVSYVFRLMNEQQRMMTDSTPTPLITRDLLGGTGTGTVAAAGGHDLQYSSKELDLDLHVPSGFEKRLDLKSGKVYLQRCNCNSPVTSASASASSSEQKQHQITTTTNRDRDGDGDGDGDHNLSPTSSKKEALSLFDDTSLDLKLFSLSTSSSTANQSVCTLDKVKSALERAERETTNNNYYIRKRSISTSNNNNNNKSCSSPTSNSSSSVVNKETDQVVDDDERSSPAAYAAGCPSCLLYVLISRSNPKCPRCNMTVPSPMAIKKPRIDLNISI